MNRFAPCPSCARHVKTGDQKCPFCGTTRRAQAAPFLGRIVRRSRSHWLAHGSTLAILGCTGNAASGPPADPDATTTATTPPNTTLVQGGDSAASDSIDAGVRDAAPGGASYCVANLATAGFAPAKGRFLCLQDGGSYSNLHSHADVYCDRATEFCFVSGGGAGEDGCHPLTCSRWLTVEAGVCDGGLLRCECLSGATCGWYFNYCVDDDAGGVSVSCGSCYGAPPARLSA